MNKKFLQRFLILITMFGAFFLSDAPKSEAAIFNIVKADVESGTTLTEDDVYDVLISFKSKYPEGTWFTNDHKYSWKGGIYTTGGGCAAFCFELSDAAFGSLPARKAVLDEYNASNMKVGDILRVDDDKHSVIILKIMDDHIVIAEANYNSTVHWGRTITYDALNDGTTSYIMTRYPDSMSTIKTVYASEIKLNPESAIVYVGDTVAIKPTIYPLTTSDASWKIGLNPAMCSVTFESGMAMVKALKAGTTILQVVAQDGSNANAYFTLTILERDEAAPAKAQVIYPQKDTQVASTIKVAAVTLKSLTNNVGGIKLKWNRNSSASGYYIYRSTDGKNYSRIKTITKNKTVSYKDKGAKKNGKKYYYKIRAYKKIGGNIYKSKYSAASATYFVSRPTISKLVNSKGRKFYVKWSANKKATGYQIQYSRNSKFADAQIIKVTGKTSRKVSKLTKNKKYYVRIRAYKKAGGKYYYSAWGKYKTVIIKK